MRSPSLPCLASPVRSAVALAAALASLHCGGPPPPQPVSPEPAAPPAPATPAAASAAAASPAEAAPASGPALQVAGPGPAAPFDCNTGLPLTAGGRRYCFHERPLSWHAASSLCAEHGGHLAATEGAAEGAALQAAAGAPIADADRFWIGLAEPSEGRWLWSNAEVPRFGDWAPGEPNDAGGGEDCGEWFVVDGRWNDAPCFSARAYLCEGEAPKAGSAGAARKRGMSCTGRHIALGSSEYCLFTSAPKTWVEAQRACVAAGGDLAVIATAEENQALRGALSPRLRASQIWLGLTDAAAEGAFRWVGGEPLQDPRWRAGEPNNLGDEDCMEWSPLDGRWNDLSCNASLPFLCEEPG